MADAAVPNHGGHRPVDVLSGSASGRNRARRRTFAASATAVFAVGALVGCDPAPPPGGDTAAGRAGAAGLPIAPLVAALGERLRDDGDAPVPAPPEWPADLRFHPAARAESIELVAVLDGTVGTERAGRADPRRSLVLVRRFDRLGVRAPSDTAAVDGEDFGFRDVVRTSVAITASGSGADAAVTERREALERATLGLAGASEERIHVRDASVAVARSADGDGDRDRDGDGDVGCGVTGGYALVGGGTDLDFRQARCPVGTRAGPFVVATSPTLAVRGSVRFRGEPVDVTGTGWVRRAWGGLPGAGGAVVFDRLLLELDGIGLVDAARSKRRSGRGPRIATATLRRPGPPATPGNEPAPEALDAVEWLDGGREGASTGAAGDVPSVWRLRAPSLGLDVVLEPIVDVPVIDAADGRTWRGGVVARGSHGGIGFVEFVPIDADAAGGAGDP